MPGKKDVPARGLAKKRLARAAAEARPSPTDSELAPWDRQPGEPPKAWAYFVAYRDLGYARSMERAGRVVGVGRGAYERMASAWRWVERAAAWDVELDRINRIEQISAIRDMKKRHAEIIVLKRELGARELGKRDRLSLEEPEPVIANEEARHLVDESMRQERLLRGEPESITHTNVTPDAPSPTVPQHDYSKLSADELRVMKSLLAKVVRQES